MKLDVETSFLVRISVTGCEGHAEAREFLKQEIESGKHQLAIATPVYPEFIHIITDSRRFPNAATMEIEIRRRNTPVARMVPVPSKPRKANWRGLRERLKKMYGGRLISGKPMEEIVSEGRGEF